MKSEYDFFVIDKENLKGAILFPFQLYVFNPVHKSYHLFLNGNRPLTKELDAFLDYLLEKGGRLAVLKNQRRTFLTSQNFTEADIPSLKSRPLHELEKERIMNIKLKEIYDTKNGAFLFQKEFELAATTDNFERIIEFARVEILTFSVTQSSTVSLALELTKNHLTKDNYLNRIVAVSYLFAKTLNILDVDTLADIICGAYLGHIGMTQLPLSMARTPSLNLYGDSKKLYEKHTILGHHLIKKGHLDISERAKKLVLDHHERINGGGYPSMKYGDTIEPLSLIVGSIAHVFEFSSGKIDGIKVPLKNIILNMKNGNFRTGLETDFGEKVFNSLVTLINTDKIEDKKAA